MEQFIKKAIFNELKSFDSNGNRVQFAEKSFDSNGNRVQFAEKSFDSNGNRVHFAEKTQRIGG